MTRPISIHRTYLPDLDVHVGRVSYRIGTRSFWLLDEDGDRDLIKVSAFESISESCTRDIEAELVSTARSLNRFMFKQGGAP